MDLRPWGAAANAGSMCPLASATAHGIGRYAVAYGHAERTLATIRLLEAETRELLVRLDELNPEHALWLRNAAESAAQRLESDGAAQPSHAS